MTKTTEYRLLSIAYYIAFDENTWLKDGQMRCDIEVFEARI